MICPKTFISTVCVCGAKEGRRTHGHEKCRIFIDPDVLSILSRICLLVAVWFLKWRIDFAIEFFA